jgi:hypothetical protein
MTGGLRGESRGGGALVLLAAAGFAALVSGLMRLLIG